MINALHFWKTNSSVQEGQGCTESRGEPRNGSKSSWRWPWWSLEAPSSVNPTLRDEKLNNYEDETLTQMVKVKLKNLLSWDLELPKNISEVHGLHPQLLWVSISVPCCLSLILVLPKREGSIYLQPDKGDQRANLTADEEKIAFMVEVSSTGYGISGPSWNPPPVLRVLLREKKETLIQLNEGETILVLCLPGSSM